MKLSAKDDDQVGHIYITPHQSFDDEDSSFFYTPPEPKRLRQNHPEDFVTPLSSYQFLLLPSLDIDSFDVESSDRHGGSGRLKLQMKHSSYGFAPTEEANLVSTETFLYDVENRIFENQELPTINTGNAKPQHVKDSISIRNGKATMKKRMACNARLL
jgi:hypothetical protein